MIKEKTPYPAIVEKNTGNSKPVILYQNRYNFYSAEQLDAMRRTLPELLRVLGVSDPENGRAFHCLHPDHDDHNPSMSYWRERGIVHCHSCNASGDAIDVAGWQEGIVGKNNFLGKIKALESLLGRSFGTPEGNSCSFHHQIRQKTQPEPYPAPETLSADAIDISEQVWKAQNDLFEPCGRDGLRYLYSRGIDDFELGMSLIGWCKHPSEIIPACKNFRNSPNGWLVFPFFDATKNSVFYATFRNLSDHKIKELKPPAKNGYPSIIYREDRLKKQDITLSVTESVLDAISYESLFGHCAIGLNGRSGVKRLLGIVYHSAVRPRKFVLALDNDDAGHSMAKEIKDGLSASGIPCETINPYQKITNVKIKDANDLLKYMKDRGENVKKS